MKKMADQISTRSQLRIEQNHDDGFFVGLKIRLGLDDACPKLEDSLRRVEDASARAVIVEGWFADAPEDNFERDVFLHCSPWA